jgi:putative transposase
MSRSVRRSGLGWVGPNVPCGENVSNVKRWQDGTMALRWCAAGMREAAKQFRRVNGHLHLAALRVALNTHFETTVSLCNDEEEAA